MKPTLRLLLSLPILLAACRSDRAQPASEAPQVAPKLSMPLTDGADAKRLHDDVAWLADDAQEGRRAGTDSGKRSGQWIAARCAELALQPAGDKGSFLQEFAVPMPVEVGAGSFVRWSGAESGDARTGSEVLPVFCSSSGEARGRLEWRGYGIINAEKGWNDYATRCDGKVVLIVRGTPPVPESSAPSPAAAAPHGGNVEASDGWGNSGSLFLKVMNAKKNGAVAVLIAPQPSEGDEPLPTFDLSRAAQPAIPALFISAQAADRLQPWWRLLVEFDDRNAPLPPAERAKSPEWPATAELPPALARSSPNRELDVEVGADVRREKGPAYNVLALLPGERHDRVVVVGAHYDHLGRGGEGSLAPGAQGEIHNGADDNASGTAVVLEMARLLRAGPKPGCDVLFALWSGEELGLLGSDYWIKHPTIALEHVVANLNLDMVGRAGNGTLSVLGAGSSPPFEAWLGEAGASAGLELKVSSSGQGIGGSDHQSFLKQQIPALHFFSGVHADYHKPTDDTERFEDAGAAKVAVLGVDLVRRMCAAGELAWTEPPAPATEQPKLGAPFRVWFGTVPDYAFEGPGLRLTGTSAGSPAEKAGMLAGDVLLQVGDVEIESIQDFMYALQIYKPGDVVLSRFQRDGKEESVRVTLSTRDAQ